MTDNTEREAFEMGLSPVPPQQDAFSYWTQPAAHEIGARKAVAFTDSARAAAEAWESRSLPATPESEEQPKRCEDCRSVGMIHCHDPANCGGPWSDAQPSQAEPAAENDDGGPIREGWTLSIADGHSGHGVYAHMDEYPEEGAFFLLSSQPAALQPQAAEPIICGALFDFLGFLTTLPKEKETTFSSYQNASPAVQLLEEWAAKRGLSLNDANVESWHAALSRHQPAAKPVEARTDAKDAERLDWLRDNLFTHHWNGVIGSGSVVQWRVAPDYRFKARDLSDASGILAGDFRRAVDNAMAALSSTIQQGGEA